MQGVCLVLLCESVTVCTLHLSNRVWRVWWGRLVKTATEFKLSYYGPLLFQMMAGVPCLLLKLQWQYECAGLSVHPLQLTKVVVQQQNIVLSFKLENVWGYMFRWQMGVFVGLSGCLNSQIFKLITYLLQLLTISSITANMPGQYNASWACCLLLTNPRWNWCISTSMCPCIAGGTTIHSPLYTTPLETANWLLESHYGWTGRGSSSSMYFWLLTEM